ncbi:MAG TPA: hypothetical protein VH186_03380 [Chloroflexia bacterium]|nr:hypothetical protein [Chloroflexia bacterium]
MRANPAIFLNSLPAAGEFFPVGSVASIHSGATAINNTTNPPEYKKLTSKFTKISSYPVEYSTKPARRRMFLRAGLAPVPTR